MHLKKIFPRGADFTLGRKGCRKTPSGWALAHIPSLARIPLTIFCVLSACPPRHTLLYLLRLATHSENHTFLTLVSGFRARQARPILQFGVGYIPHGGQFTAGVWAGAIAYSRLFDFFDQLLHCNSRTLSCDGPASVPNLACKFEGPECF